VGVILSVPGELVAQLGEYLRARSPQGAQRVLLDVRARGRLM